MKLQYLGTAAAEAVPALFCECAMCERARELGGKELRLRSGLVLDDRLLLDFPPDVYESCRRFGIPLHKVTDIVITHAHGDHLDCDELSYRRDPSFCIRKDPTPLRLWGTAYVRETLESRCGERLFTSVDFREIAYYTPFEVSGYTFTALPANHMQPEERDGVLYPDRLHTPCIYLIEKDGKRILYAHDTGVIFDEVFDFLKGKHLDFISFDCCYGPHSNGSHHMGLPQNGEARDRLAALGAVDASTRIVVNHFSHNGLRFGEELYTHDRLYAAAARYGMVPAYDGMTVRL